METTRKITSQNYSACHKWLSRNFTKLEKCEHCKGSNFIEWALKKGENHCHDRNAYLCLCSSCHKKYDYTDERRKKLSKSLKKVPHTEEWNRKVSLGQMGKVMSLESRKKMSDYKKKNPPQRDPVTGRFKKKQK